MAALLDAEIITMHPFVLAEIALGTLRDRAKTLSRLDSLEQLSVAATREVAKLIETAPLHGRGIGYVDAHLLAATLLTPGTRLWTRDRRLREAAEALDVAARPAE
jgi:predicted nucleic acid-binding protein